MFIKPKQIFLIDGIGAVVSSLLLVFVACNEPIFGMPGEVLLKIIPIAITAAVLSLSCYFVNLPDRQKYLSAIIILNITYCCLTLLLMITFFRELTVPGMLYFMAEKLIIILLIVFELRQIKKNNILYKSI